MFAIKKSPKNAKTRKHMQRSYKRKNWQRIMRQGTSKMPLSSYFVGHLWLNMESAFKSSLYINWNSTDGKTKFLFAGGYQLVIIPGLDVGPYPLPFPVLGPHQVKTYIGPVHAATVSVSSYESWNLETLFS